MSVRLNPSAIALVAALACAPTTPSFAAVNLVNRGFDPMGVPLPNGYAYLSGQQAGWTFSPPSPNVGYGFGGTGIAANGSAFNIYNAPGGTAAFLQGSTSVSQSFSLASTSDVSVAFLAQGRPYLAGPAPLRVSIDSTELRFGGTGTLMAPYGNWHHFYANTIRLSAGAHTLTFSTTFPGAEATTFIDEVTVGSVSAVPEPSEWAMMLGGLGFLGLTARLRRAAGHRTSRRA